MAHVSATDRDLFARQAAALAAADTDDPGTPEQRRRLLELINAIRIADGSEPFPDEDQEPYEVVFHRRAKALGMARSAR